MEKFEAIQERVIRCRKCPRLCRYLAEIKKEHRDFWSKPVPAFGDERARILVLGLAPGRFGSNRTGRMFTGDASGDFLYPVLYETGLASKSTVLDRDDGQKLIDSLITAVVRCAPPQNRPLREEIENCRLFWQSEIETLPQLKVVVALGKIAHDEYVRYRLSGEGEQGLMKDFPFRHGAARQFAVRPKILIDSYHPSRQNTNTGKLTKEMFKNVFRKAVEFA